MSRFHSYLHSAEKIVQVYNGAVPLAVWLKDYFRQHKQMGSKDRKMIAELVYCYYRLGHSLTNIPIQEKIITGLFLCNRSYHEVLQQLKPAWNERIELPHDEKQSLVQAQYPYFRLTHIFPWQAELSDSIDPLPFARSFLQQPDLFIRIRPGHEQSVRQKLDTAQAVYHDYANNCLAVANATKLQDIFSIDKEVVIQDYNSQQTGNYFFDTETPLPAVWDCCAASGGKSIMAHDLHPILRLTVSDIRASILHNLNKRFQHAGMQRHHSLITDLSVPNPRMPAQSFDLIIADVPCSGSGTWARTPEQLAFFQPDKINAYHVVQKRIVSSVISKLKKDGRLVYITCSVFKKENEDVVNFMTGELNLQLDTMATLKGYEKRADSMFVAVLSRKKAGQL